MAADSPDRLLERVRKLLLKAEANGVTPEELYTPIPYVIPAQLFAASLAEVKRLDPDRPRTLSKVTQTM